MHHLSIISQGGELIKKKFEDDLRYGTSYRLNYIFRLRGIGIIQGEDRVPKISLPLPHNRNSHI